MKFFWNSFMNGWISMVYIYIFLNRAVGSVGLSD